MCELFPGLGERSRKSALPPPQYGPREPAEELVWGERESGGDCLDNLSLPRLCIVNASQTLWDGPAFVSWFIVLIMEHEKRLHTRHRRRFIPFFFICIAPKHVRLSRGTKSSRILKAFLYRELEWGQTFPPPETSSHWSEEMMRFCLNVLCVSHSRNVNKEPVAWARFFCSLSHWSLF